MKSNSTTESFVSQFRASAPYINAFRGKTFVIYFSGQAISSTRFADLVHDIALLHSLDIRLILVHGARPQIDTAIADNGHFVDDVRVTDDATLAQVKAAVGTIRLEIEARLSMGLANSPMAGAAITVASGNFITAKPFGVREGIDFLHTGEVRKVDTVAIQNQLDKHAIVLLSPVGYSPTGEIFNLRAEDVAFAAASALGADKLLCLFEDNLIRDSKRQLVRQLSSKQVNAYISKRKKLDFHTRHILSSAVECCASGVDRIHFLDRHIDGALLQELFTLDGIGSLISANLFEGTRRATIDDITGILELIEPMEKEGILVRRSREKLEMGIDRFTVVERDGVVIACAAIVIADGQNAAELACLAVHPDYQQKGRGDTLLTYLVQQAKSLGIEQLYVLSTRTSHWFLERGFKQSEIDALPVKRKSLYNYQRKSKVFVKSI